MNSDDDFGDFDVDKKLLNHLNKNRAIRPKRTRHVAGASRRDTIEDEVKQEDNQSQFKAPEINVEINNRAINGNAIMTNLSENELKNLGLKTRTNQRHSYHGSKIMHKTQTIDKDKEKIEEENEDKIIFKKKPNELKNNVSSLSPNDEKDNKINEIKNFKFKNRIEPKIKNAENIQPGADVTNNFRIKLKHVETKQAKEEPQHTSSQINKPEDERFQINTKIVEKSIENKEKESILQNHSNPFLIKLKPTSKPPQLPPKPRDLKVKTEVTIANQVPTLEINIEKPPKPIQSTNNIPNKKTLIPAEEEHKEKKVKIINNTQISNTKEENFSASRVSRSKSVKERVNNFSKVNNEDLASINKVKNNLKLPEDQLRLKSTSPSQPHDKSRMPDEKPESDKINGDITRNRAKSVKLDEDRANKSKIQPNQIKTVTPTLVQNKVIGLKGRNGDKKCHNCKGLNHSKAKYCCRCGSELKKICSKCSVEADDSSVMICYICGGDYI